MAFLVWTAMVSKSSVTSVRTRQANNLQTTMAGTKLNECIYGENAVLQQEGTLHFMDV